MKKLLHERLRIWADAENTLVSIQEDERIIHLSDMLKKWADEIERYYIPRPRYEDGEPIQWNEEYQADSGKTARLTQIFLRATGKVVLGKQGKRAELPVGTFVKRPQPKVLDADGVEINVGDTVWHTHTRDKAIVDEILQGTDYCVRLNWGHGIKSNYLGEVLTHKEPDSLEKLRDDMKKWYKSGGIHSISEYIDRLSALIERGV